MKTAIERYMETITVQEKQRILAEEEMANFFTSDLDSVMQIIENGIDLSVENGEFSRTITFIQKIYWTKYNGTIRPWVLTLPRSKWTDYNEKARGYYKIPTHSIYMPNIDGVIENLQNNGYKCSVKETFISEATSRTGRYADNIPAYEVTIDWKNNLLMLGAKS